VVDKNKNSILGDNKILLILRSMQLRKTITSASFFFALFFSQAGYYFIYSIQENYLQEQSEEKINSGVPDETLTAIDFGAEEKNIQWKELGKEFYLHGQIFDIAKKKNVNGKTIIYCLNDRSEGKLLQEFNKVARSGSDQNTDGKNSKQTTKFQFTDLIIAAKKTSVIDVDLGQNYFSFDDKNMTRLIEVKSPPPRC